MAKTELITATSISLPCCLSCLVSLCHGTPWKLAGVFSREHSSCDKDKPSQARRMGWLYSGQLPGITVMAREHSDKNLVGKIRKYSPSFSNLSDQLCGPPRNVLACNHESWSETKNRLKNNDPISDERGQFSMVTHVELIQVCSKA